MQLETNQDWKWVVAEVGETQPVGPRQFRRVTEPELSLMRGVDEHDAAEGPLGKPAELVVEYEQ